MKPTTDEDTVQEVIKYFAAVGVKAAYKGFERSLYEEHHGANEIEAAWWGGDRTVVPLVNPTIWTCEQPDRPWAAGWAHWRNSGGTNPAGVEPPAGHWVWTIWEIWDAIKIEPDAEKQTAMFYQILDIWVPMLIVAVNGTAGNIRITRANLLDEINKPYVETARAKGVKEGRLIWKYPVRVALNPFFSTVGWSLASLISGTTLVAMVLSLPTTGPMLLRSLTSQDMYLAGSFLFLLSTLTIIGTLMSDVLLAIVDPRIRME